MKSKSIRKLGWVLPIFASAMGAFGQQIDNPEPGNPFYYGPYRPKMPCCETCTETDAGDPAHCILLPSCAGTSSVYFSVGFGRTTFQRKSDYLRAAVMPTHNTVLPSLAHKNTTFEENLAFYRQAPLTARRQFQAQFAQQHITAASYLPSALIADQEAGGDKIQVSGAIRQVLTDDYFADIQPLSAVHASLPSAIGGAVPASASGFVVRTWFAGTQGAKTGSPALYGVPAGDPLGVVVFYNPDSTANGKLNIIHSAKFNATSYKTLSYCYEENPTSHDWLQSVRSGLPSGTILEQTELDVTAWTNDKDFTQVRTVRRANLSGSGSLGALTEVDRIQENYDNIAGVSRLVEEVAGFGTTAPKATRYGWYNSTATGATFGRLKWVTYPDGSYVYYDYTFNPTGPSTIIKKMPWLDQAWNPATAPSGPTGMLLTETTVITPSSSPSLPSFVYVDKRIGSQQVGYSEESTVFMPNGALQVSKTQWTSNLGSLGTTTEYYPASDPVYRANRIHWRTLTDGAVEQYTYGAPDSSGNYTQTVDRGAGTTSGVTSGTRKRSIRNNRGVVIEEIVSHLNSGTLIELDHWVSDDIDFFGRPGKRIWSFSGSAPMDFEQFEYSCCGLKTFRDRSGIVTEYFRDDLKREYKNVETMGTRVVTETTSYNGLEIESRRLAGALDLLVSKVIKHLNGDLITSHGPDQNGDGTDEITQYSNAYSASTGPVITEERPDHSTIITGSYLDGRKKSEGGTATTPVAYNYGAELSGTWAQIFTGGTTEWTKSHFDFAGREFKTTSPDGALKTVFYHNSAAAVGARGKISSIKDADENALAGSGTHTEYAYGYVGGNFATTVTEHLSDNQTRVLTTTEDAVASVTLKGNTFGPASRSVKVVNGITTSTNYRSSDGRSKGSLSFGLENLTTSTVPLSGSWIVTHISSAGQKSKETYTEGLLEKSESLDNKTTPLVIASTSYTYDGLGRVLTTTDSRTGLTTYDANNDGAPEVTAAGNPRYVKDAGNRVTQFTYDVMGRKLTTVLPDTSISHTTYTSRGQTEAEWGSQSYPTFKTYDPHGRLFTLRTKPTLDPGGIPTDTGGSVTTWLYNAQRGFLTEKNYHGETDDGTTDADYGYTLAGRLQTRRWERGVTTTYGYDAGMLETVTYSGETGYITPNVSYSYDAFGRTRVVNQGGSPANTHTYAYKSDSNGSGGTLGNGLAVHSETVAYGGPGITRTLVRYQDPVLRNSGWQLFNGPSIEGSNTYSYDDFSRLKTITGLGTGTHTYSYVPNSEHLVEGVDNPPTATYLGEKIGYVSNSWEATRNELDVRNNFWVSAFDHTVNDIGQREKVVAWGTMTGGYTYGYKSTGEVESAQHASQPAAHRAYGYDAVGNITGRASGTFAGPPTPDWVSNALNQYTAIGSFSGFAYDADGNTTTGVFAGGPTGLQSGTLTWDAENQLVASDVQGTTATYGYDYRGRRISKTSFGTTLSFIYDDWNLAFEFAGTSLLRAHTWGLDLSGSLQGAGGVGGLLATKVASGPGVGSYYPLFDGNGNVTDYIDSAGSPVAHHEYDPFGNIIHATGTHIGYLPFRFSTKYHDNYELTQFSYYGYRYYQPFIGRWPSRDPIWEIGGVNIYSNVNNNLVNDIDVLGEGPLLPLVTAGFGTDVAVPEPTDVAWPKWAGWAAAFALAAVADVVIDAVTDDSSDDVDCPPEKFPLKSREKRNDERRDKPKDPKEKEKRQRENEDDKRRTGRGGRDPRPKGDDW